MMFTFTERELITKARRSYYAHARACRPGSKYAHRKMIGWTIPKMVERLKNAVTAGCFYGPHPFTSLRDMTFEIVDSGDWDFDTNVVICCNRCNSEKGRAGLGTPHHDTLEAWPPEVRWYRRIRNSV